VQDTCPAPSSFRWAQYRPAPPSGKNRIRKNGIDFKTLRKTFLRIFSR
jgi:hypothetical protein